MGREFELKYRADAGKLAAIEAAFSGFTSISMETTYYDTPSFSLRPLRWMFRRRLENGVSVCTLKTPLPDGSRGEWEAEEQDVEEAASKLCKLGAPAELESLLSEGIIQVCAARFTRLAAAVEADGCTVEIALDRGCLIGGGREMPLWEVEVELKEGAETAAVTFAQSLAAQFGLTPEPDSKYKRALALATGE